MKINSYNENQKNKFKEHILKIILELLNSCIIAEIISVSGFDCL